MSDYTTSYRWAGVTRADVKGLLRHDARDVEKQNGTEVAHSNTNIDARFTAMNTTLVNDGAGNMVPMRRVQDALDFLDARLAETQNKRVRKDGTEVPVALRKDAAAVVEFVLMLDPKFTRDSSMTDDEYDALTRAEYKALSPDVVSMTPESIAQTRRLLGVMRDEVLHQMGVENTVFITEHWDEAHPHIQMACIPVTEDNQVSMKRKLAAPTKALSRARYVQLHDSMRGRLSEAGYDATPDRVSAGKRHLPLNDYKRQRDRERLTHEALQWVEDERSLLIERAAGLSSREAALSDREVAWEADEPNRRRAARLKGELEGRKAGEAAYATVTRQAHIEATNSATATQLAARRTRDDADDDARAIRADAELGRVSQSSTSSP